MKEEDPKKEIKVFVTHFRKFQDYFYFLTRWEGKELGLGSPLSKGGVTEAIVVDGDGKILATGMASCCPKDSYNKKIGRDIATGRALKKLEHRRVKPVRG